MVSLKEFQMKLYNALTSNLNGVTVYDHRPHEPAYPYVRFRLTVNDISTKTEVNYEVGLDILAFSTYPGNREIYELTDTILQSINDSSLTSSNNQAQVILDNQDILDEDEDLKATVLNYRVILT